MPATTTTTAPPITLRRVLRLDTGTSLVVSEDLLRWGIEARPILLHYGMTRTSAQRLPEDVPYVRIKADGKWCARVQFVEEPAAAPVPTSELRRQFTSDGVLEVLAVGQTASDVAWGGGAR